MDNNNRALKALLSSLLPDLLLLLFLISGHTSSSPATPLSPLIIHLLSLSQTATAISLKRNQSKSPDHSKRRRLNSNSPIPKSPQSFTLCFNMNSSTFQWLSSLLEPLLECRDPVNSPLNLPVETRLGIGLFRLATGADYINLSQRFHVSEAVAKFCVNQLCRVLCTNFRFWLGFPTSNELKTISDSFETLTGLPNCCGVMNCTRFVVSKHEHEHERETLAAQIVSDSSSRILNIVAGYNGRKSNQLVLKLSSLYNDIESNRLLNDEAVDINGVSIPQYFVGDGGYHVLPWLMVPFDRPVANLYEEKFNSAYDSMMVSGFRTVDSLRKWGVLSKPIEVEVKTMVGYIGACSILHNALLTREDYSCLSDKSDECLRFSCSREDEVVDISLKDDLIEQKGFEIRNALATRAR
ncbi:hypothetical protein QVD17_19133 [Tagetes erecta]|uniref:DDE Tnp4 domain-containing protein n=1 Tax=Tagetes erecta TaxID=13708 RepID=A0AAD8KIZ2_TARER|nr:hypothetical protein QVD17_19133 [Tagetes erecta]